MLRPSTLRRLGGYDLETCIAAGATTHVYRARSPAMPGPVAVKLLSPALSVHPELVTRFREERVTQTAGSLTYTTLLSLVPLFTVALAVSTAFPVFNEWISALQLFIL